mgnify:CR=1 FL=1
MNIADISFRNKIFILLALPILGFLWLSINTIIENIEIKNEMATIAPLTELSVVYGELVHELQIERGITAGYLGSKGAKFKSQLRAQRQNTDQKYAQQMNFWNENDFALPNVIQLHSSIVDMQQELASIRREVDDQSIELSKEQIQLLNDRLKSFEADQNFGSSWSDVKSRIIG